MKIRTLLIILLACFAIIPSVIFANLSNSFMRDTAMTNYENIIRTMTETQANNVGEYLSTLSRISKQISSDYYVEASKNDSSKLNAFIDTYNTLIEKAADSSVVSFDVEKIIIADASGKIIANTGETLKDSKTVNQTLENIGKLKDGQTYCYFYKIFSDAESDSEGTEDPIVPTATSNYKLVCKYKSGSNNVIVIFNGERAKNIATASSVATNCRMILIDGNDAIFDGTAYFGTTDENKGLAYKKLKSNASAGSATQINNFKGENATDIPTIGFTMTLPSMGGAADDWSLSIVGETDKAYEASSAAIGGVIGIIVFLSILFIVAGVIISIVITKPIKIIEETLVKVRRGDHEARINIMTKNEYGEIARAFNDLIDDIIVSEGRYRTIIEMSDNIIFEWNFKANEVVFSNNFNKKFSYRAPSDHFGDSFLLKVKVHPEDNDRYRKDLELLSKGEEFKGSEYRWKNIYGDYIWILLRTATIKDREGAIAKIVGVIVDIDRAKKSEKMLMERASYDSLTALYNRESIERTIDNEIELLNIRKSQFAVLFIDIDDFKIYNDQYSHATGDQVLKFVGSTISELTEGFGTAGRYGGDEFIVCVRNIEINDPSKVAQDILNKLREGFVCDSGDKLSVNTSIGISIISDSSMRVDEIIGMADDAMYKIKKSGKSNFGILNKPINVAAEMAAEAAPTAPPSTVDEEDNI